MARLPCSICDWLSRCLTGRLRGPWSPQPTTTICTHVLTRGAFGVRLRPPDCESRWLRAPQPWTQLISQASPNASGRTERASILRTNGFWLAADRFKATALAATAKSTGHLLSRKLDGLET